MEGKPHMLRRLAIASVGAEAFWAVARTATAEEKPARWDRMVELYPDYADYQVKTDREIPIVILERER